MEVTNSEDVSMYIYYSMDISNPDSINPNLEYRTSQSPLLRDQSIFVTEIAVKKYPTHHRGDRLESFGISSVLVPSFSSFSSRSFDHIQDVTNN
jgi:hypothetical protein